MKQAEIQVGHYYLAKVNNNLVTVRVDNIHTRGGYDKYGISDRTMYDVTNTKTGRKTTFRSAQKFRKEVFQPV